MAKNIVICSDGTGNTFDKNITSVTNLVKRLELSNHNQQVAVYDQGIGTSADRSKAIATYAERLADSDTLKPLRPPMESSFLPVALFYRARGLATGFGLKENVREMYKELANLFSDEDRIFLFGFSRGAFTVRALAGLLYRCRLPMEDNIADSDSLFEKAWAFFQPMQETEEAKSFREKQRPCDIYFLGIWDTVKSYGGLNPVILPHLRHNPIVKNVRHALALDEHRAWFQPTTWGLLDSDKDGAMTRLKKEDRPLYEEQKKNIEEVWFTGCHSDIGGGEKEAGTAQIALRWMLGEAVNIEYPLMLNEDGIKLLNEADPPPQIHESQNAKWWLIEKVPRAIIDNSGVYPFKKFAHGNDGQRDLEKLRRDGKIVFHATVKNMRTIASNCNCEFDSRDTKPLPN